MKKTGDKLGATSLTLDSSVIVTALRKDEEKHASCKKLLEEVVKGKIIAYEPCIVLAEVSSAIKRRSRSSSLAHRALNMLTQDGTGFRLIELNIDRGDKAARIAIDTEVRGMDAMFVQVAKEFESTLVTLDQDVSSKVKSVVGLMEIDA